MGMEKKSDSGKRPGPEPERLKIDGTWEEAAAKALKKKRPASGWPKESRYSGKKKGT